MRANKLARYDDQVVLLEELDEFFELVALGHA